MQTDQGEESEEEEREAGASSSVTHGLGSTSAGAEKKRPALPFDQAKDALSAASGQQGSEAKASPRVVFRKGEFIYWYEGEVMTRKQYEGSERVATVVHNAGVPLSCSVLSLRHAPSLCGPRKKTLLLLAGMYFPWCQRTCSMECLMCVGRSVRADRYFAHLDPTRMKWFTPYALLLFDGKCKSTRLLSFSLRTSVVRTQTKHCTT